MKKRINLFRFIFFVVFLCMSILGLFRLTQFIKAEVMLSVDEVEASPEPEPEPIKQGTIKVVNLDEESGTPIEGSEYEIIDLATGTLLQTMRTDEKGEAYAYPLDYGRQYQIVQKAAPLPYARLEQPVMLTLKQEPYRQGSIRWQPEQSEQPVILTLNQEGQQVIIKNSLRSYVIGTYAKEDGRLGISGVSIPVGDLMQNPELPNGCEITALTALLNAYGYEVDKLDMADNYLNQVGFRRENGKLIGPDPYQAYAGNPRERTGFFVYAPPIVEAGNKYLEEAGGNHWAYDLSNSSPEEILAELDEGRPVVIWVTLDLSPPNINYSWLLNDTGETFMAPVNLHAVVLYGYEGSTVQIMDSLKGQVSYPMEAVFRSYRELGSHAVGIAEKTE